MPVNQYVVCGFIMPIYSKSLILPDLIVNINTYYYAYLYPSGIAFLSGSSSTLRIRVHLD